MFPFPSYPTNQCNFRCEPKFTKCHISPQPWGTWGHKIIQHLSQSCIFTSVPTFSPIEDPGVQIMRGNEKHLWGSIFTSRYNSLWHQGIEIIYWGIKIIFQLSAKYDLQFLSYLALMLIHRRHRRWHRGRHRHQWSLHVSQLCWWHNKTAHAQQVVVCILKYLHPPIVYRENENMELFNFFMYLVRYDQ